MTCARTRLWQWYLYSLKGSNIARSTVAFGFGRVIYLAVFLNRAPKASMLIGPLTFFQPLSVTDITISLGIATPSIARHVAHDQSPRHTGADIPAEIVQQPAHRLAGLHLLLDPMPHASRRPAAEAPPVRDRPSQCASGAVLVRRAHAGA